MAVIEGEVIHIGDLENITASFRKRVVVVRTDEKYPQEVPVEFTQDRVGLVDEIAVGDRVCISANIRGREWKGRGKWFVSIQAWRVEASDGHSGPDQRRNPDPADDDDIPF